MEARREELRKWITEQHHEQRRKDGEYYPNHLYRVAERAEQFVKYGYEIGLCHDLIEDTPWTTRQLWEHLQSLGYDTGEVELICKAVHHLTEVYSSDNYPWLNREQRKRLEADRLFAIEDRDTVTVKYCDLLDNVGAAKNLPSDFRKKYLEEKAHVIDGLDQGSQELYAEVKQALAEAQKLDI